MTKLGKDKCDQSFLDEQLDETNKYDWSALHVPRFSTETSQGHVLPTFVRRIFLSKKVKLERKRIPVLGQDNTLVHCIPAHG